MWNTGKSNRVEFCQIPCPFTLCCSLSVPSSIIHVEVMLVWTVAPASCEWHKPHPHLLQLLWLCSSRRERWTHAKAQRPSPCKEAPAIHRWVLGTGGSRVFHQLLIPPNSPDTVQCKHLGKMFLARVTLSNKPHCFTLFQAAHSDIALAKTTSSS